MFTLQRKQGAVTTLCQQPSKKVLAKGKMQRRGRPSAFVFLRIRLILMILMIFPFFMQISISVFKAAIKICDHYLKNQNHQNHQNQSNPDQDKRRRRSPPLTSQSKPSHSGNKYPVSSLLPAPCHPVFRRVLFRPRKDRRAGAGNIHAGDRKGSSGNP